MSTGTSHHRFFPEPRAVSLMRRYRSRFFCSQGGLGSTRTQIITDASEKDVAPRNQKHAPKKRKGHLPCANSITTIVGSTTARHASWKQEIQVNRHCHIAASKCEFRNKTLQSKKHVHFWFYSCRYSTKKIRSTTQNQF